MPSIHRNLLVAGAVVLLHLAALWALQNGLLRRAIEVFVPVQVLSELVEPPRPVEVPPPIIERPAAVAKQAMVKTVKPTPAPPPQLQAVPVADPAPNAPTAIATAPAPLAPLTVPVESSLASGLPTPAQPAPSAPSAPARVVLPSSDAEYLQNAKRRYPPDSLRRGEQGTVVVEVLIGIDGTAQTAQIKKSSGFERLDQAALATVLKWRYIPGKRAGVPEAMAFEVSIIFNLE